MRCQGQKRQAQFDPLGTLRAWLRQQIFIELRSGPYSLGDATWQWIGGPLIRTFLTVQLKEIDGALCEYRIYFIVERGKEESRRTRIHCVRLIVQSAFAVPKNVPEPRAARRQSIGFRVILNRALGLNRSNA